MIIELATEPKPKPKVGTWLSNLVGVATFLHHLIHSDFFLA